MTDIQNGKMIDPGETVLEYKGRSIQLLYAAYHCDGMHAQ